LDILVQIFFALYKYFYLLTYLFAYHTRKSQTVKYFGHILLSYLSMKTVLGPMRGLLRRRGWGSNENNGWRSCEPVRCYQSWRDWWVIDGQISISFMDSTMIDKRVLHVDQSINQSINLIDHFIRAQSDW